MIICSAYLDIEKAVLTPELKNVVAYCEDNSLGLILGMDSNAHSTLWGNEDNNSRGDALEEYVMENILDCHNIPDQPTFIGRGCSTTIDLTLSNRHFTGEIMNWTTNDEAVTTDHTLITFDCEAHNRIKAPKNYIFSKTDWTRFQQITDEVFQDHQQPETWSEIKIEREYNWFIGVIHSALKSTTPYRAPVRKIQAPTFWNDELRAMKRRSLKLLKAHRYRPDS